MSGCGPLELAIFAGQPVPAHTTQIRRPPSFAAAWGDRGLDLRLLAHVGLDEVRPELVGQSLALLGVDVGDRDVGALVVEPSDGRLTEPGGPADDDRCTALR